MTGGGGSGARAGTEGAAAHNDSLMQNIELLQKLQKAEAELQTYRLANMKKTTPNMS